MQHNGRGRQSQYTACRNPNLPRLADGDGSVECGACDGQGSGDGPIVVFTDLNDTVLPESGEPPPKAVSRPISWARKILAAYNAEKHPQRDLDKAAAKTLENA